MAKGKDQNLEQELKGLETQPKETKETVPEAPEEPKETKTMTEKEIAIADINDKIISFYSESKPNLVVYHDGKPIQFASGLYMTNSKKEIEFLKNYPGIEIK